MNAPPEWRRRVILWAVGLALVASVAFQGSRGLYETTEGRYVECARQTLASGDIDDPVLNGEFHWTKPPLTYMCIAAGLAVFGENAWGARAFLAAAFVLTAVVIYLLGTAIWGEETGACAALVWATSPFPMAAANMVSTDMLLTLCESLTILFFWLGIRRQRPTLILCMWLALGAAFVTKGPAALLPLCGILPAYILLRRGTPGTPALVTPVGLLVFAVTGLGWYLAEAWEHPGLLRYWVMDETVGRNLRGEFNRNPEFYKAFAIYIPVLALGAGQWAGLLLAKHKAFPPRRRLAFRELARTDLIPWVYLACAFLIPLVILSLSTSKLALYVLPLFVPLSLAVGAGVQWLVHHGKTSVRTVAVLACAGVAAFVGVKGSLAHIELRQDMKYLARYVQPVMQEHPGWTLYSVTSQPLNGLEFYLHRRIPVLSIEEARRAVTASQGEHASCAAILLRSKDLPKLEERAVLAHTGGIRRLGPHWTLVTGTVGPHQLARTTPAGATPPG